MFRGKEKLDTKARKDKLARFPLGVHVIFNTKAYANGENLKQWARQEYKWGLVYSPLDYKPRLLSIDAFVAHKKTVSEKRAQDDFISELKKLNTTVSMILAGATGYVQVCDGFANRKIKELILAMEEAHYDLHEAEYQAGKFTVSDRRVLLATWVDRAFTVLHEEYGDQIRKAF
jgi:hypothetical protein